jgi:hypothetical protein
MYVTLTRVQPKTPALESTARMLAAATTTADYKVTINSASFFKASLLIAVSAILTIFAF